MSKQMKTVWDKMNQEEKGWVTAEGWTEEVVNGSPVEDSINFLHLRYAMNGRILADSHAMAKRLRGK